jgi:hypothetical protein
MKAQCTPSPYRRITRWEHEAVLEAAQRRLDRIHDAMIVKRRTVEHVFGTFKSWMGHTHFLMRPLPNVSTEMSLTVLAYKLKRVLSILGFAKDDAGNADGGGVSPLISLFARMEPATSSRTVPIGLYPRISVRAPRTGEVAADSVPAMSPRRVFTQPRSKAAVAAADPADRNVALRHYAGTLRAPSHSGWCAESIARLLAQRIR